MITEEVFILRTLVDFGLIDDETIEVRIYERLHQICPCGPPASLISDLLRRSPLPSCHSQVIRERFKQLAKPAKASGMPMIDLPNLYTDLVKQGRVADANVVASDRLEARKQRASRLEEEKRRRAAELAALARERARDLLFNGRNTVPATPPPVALEEEEADTGDLHQLATPAVDMSTDDLGYKEWFDNVCTHATASLSNPVRSCIALPLRYH